LQLRFLAEILAPRFLEEMQNFADNLCRVINSCHTMCFPISYLRDWHLWKTTCNVTYVY